jgi:riboflavin kinase / FMN adenylyltransferase
MLGGMSGATVITVGNFDGVHLGHQALVRDARALADKRDARVVVLCFAEHPLTVLKPQHAPPVITDLSQRAGALLESGADQIEWLHPEPALLTLDPRQFAQRVVEQLHPIGWVEGPDFRFGRGRAGDVQLLRALGSELGFDVRVVEPVTVVLADKSRCAVSSSLLRWLVACGRVVDARHCLGRPFAVRGEVVRGDQRGRTIGFPTANLAVDGRLLPADGVYSGSVAIAGRIHGVAISVGAKPTFGRRHRVLEAHLLDYDGDLYGQSIEVNIHRWLRDQWAFPTVESLIAQMNRDIAAVRQHGERVAA